MFCKRVSYTTHATCVCVYARGLRQSNVTCLCTRKLDFLQCRSTAVKLVETLAMPQQLPKHQINSRQVSVSVHKVSRQCPAATAQKAGTHLAWNGCKTSFKRMRIWKSFRERHTHVQQKNLCWLAWNSSMGPLQQTRRQRCSQIIGNSIIHSHLYWLLTNLYTLQPC